MVLGGGQKVYVETFYVLFPPLTLDTQPGVPAKLPFAALLSVVVVNRKSLGHAAGRLLFVLLALGLGLGSRLPATRPDVQDFPPP